ncbi:MAG: phage tail protein [Clostridiales bacterium]|nr:phage tail protein [Clostridiales bacterium]
MNDAEISKKSEKIEDAVLSDKIDLGVKPVQIVSPAVSPNIPLSAASRDSCRPCGNFMFRVEIDGGRMNGFFECTGLGSGIEVIPYRDGTDPKRVRKQPGMVVYSDVKLKWGVTDSRDMYDWYKCGLDGNVERKNVSIILINENGNEIARWCLTNAWPSAYEGPNFAAFGTDMAYESLTLVCERMERAW